MISERRLTRILAFLDRHELAALATVHAGRSAPECGIVGFGHNDRLELVFGTSTETRKYRNLLDSPRVALVVGWSSAVGSLQYEGLASELTPEHLAGYLPLLVRKNADHARFAELPQQRYFVVRPTWLRFFDNLAEPPDEFEWAFNDDGLSPSTGS